MSELTKRDLPDVVRKARFEKQVPWADIAEAIGKPLVWTVSAVLGQHPMSEDDAVTVADMLGLDSGIVTLLQMQPVRGSDPALRSDPTVYRFYEALDVYAPALKELIHEEFGDGIMSAINFQVEFGRREDASGDRVTVTFDGKFLDYNW